MLMQLTFITSHHSIPEPKEFSGFASITWMGPGTLFSYGLLLQLPCAHVLYLVST